MRAMETLITNYLSTNDFVKLVHGAHSIMPRLRYSKPFQSLIGEVVHGEMSRLSMPTQAYQKLLVLDMVLYHWFKNGNPALLLRAGDKKDILLMKVKTDWAVVVRDGAVITRTHKDFSHEAVYMVQKQYAILVA